jgi:hypothetical protein
MKKKSDLARLTPAMRAQALMFALRAAKPTAEQIGQSLNALAQAIGFGLEIAESDAQVVGSIQGQPVTRGELSLAFARVRNPKNWKFAIDATVTLATDREILTLREAVIFFTGSVPSITVVIGQDGLRYRVQAAGYYQTVGA